MNKFLISLALIGLLGACSDTRFSAPGKATRDAREPAAGNSNNVTPQAKPPVAPLGQAGTIRGQQGSIIEVPPACVLSADKLQIFNGDSLKLTLDLTKGGKVDSATLDTAAIDLTKELVFERTPTQSTTFEVIVQGPGGEARCSVAVTVNERAPECNLIANPEPRFNDAYEVTVEKKGGLITSVNINNATVNVNDPKVIVSARVPTTHTAEVTGPGGTATCSVSVKVCHVINAYFRSWIDGNTELEFRPNELIIRHSREYPPGGIEVLSYDDCDNTRIARVLPGILPDHASLQHRVFVRSIPANLDGLLLSNADVKWAPYISHGSFTDNTNWISPSTNNRAGYGLWYNEGTSLRFGAFDSPPGGAAFYNVAICKRGYSCPFY